MGTNYYWVETRDSKFVSRERIMKDMIHIGKSSAGWCFALHVTEKYPNWSSWLKALRTSKNRMIINEYFDPVSLIDFHQTVTKRKCNTPKNYYPAMWYSSQQDYLEKNNAIWGPNNLFRHKKDGKHCIGHGFGTYDYITGEFS